MRNNKGITLIALVITIIVLLILAGVSIAMLTGSNGILTQATEAKKDTAAAEAVERINMALSAAYSATLQTPSVAPTVDNVKAHDSIFASTSNGYNVSATGADATAAIQIQYSKDGITVTGSILKASPYTVDPAEMPAS